MTLAVVQCSQWGIRRAHAGVSAVISLEMCLTDAKARNGVPYSGNEIKYFTLHNEDICFVVSTYVVECTGEEWGPYCLNEKDGVFYSKKFNRKFTEEYAKILCRRGTGFINTKTLKHL